jgi:hypothetical protein
MDESVMILNAANYFLFVKLIDKKAFRDAFPNLKILISFNYF